MFRFKKLICVVLVLVMVLSLITTAAIGAGNVNSYKTLVLIIDGTAQNGEAHYKELFQNYQNFAIRTGFKFNCDLNEDWLYYARNPVGLDGNATPYTLEDFLFNKYGEGFDYDIVLFSMDGVNFEGWSFGKKSDTNIAVHGNKLKKSFSCFSLDPIAMGLHGFVHEMANAVWLEFGDNEKRKRFMEEYGNVDVLTLGALQKLPASWFNKPLEEYIDSYSNVEGMWMARAEMLYTCRDPQHPNDPYYCKRERESQLLLALDEWYGWREAYYNWFHAQDVIIPTPDPDPIPTPDPSTLPFNDVSTSDWFYSYVKYVYDHGIMAGTGVGFEPHTNLNRAMVATVLYRLESEPVSLFQDVFVDVADGIWYSAPITWAYQNNIVAGYGDMFGPGDEVTREQLATMIYRYAQYKGIETSARADIGGFADVSQVSDWARDAVRWCVAEVIIVGIGDNLSPTGSATRAQCATILQRLMTK